MEQSSASIIYVPGANSTPEAELGALAAVYRFVLATRAMKEAAPESRPNYTNLTNTKEVNHIDQQPD
jgi:NADH:ubiquinone oxidoreductase subunit B-like Fe-S oxidoreductase